MLLHAPSYAGDPADFEAEITQAQSYLNSLATAQSRFIQTTHDGGQLVGTFYLSRPGKLRFEYDPPIEDFVVADGLFLYFYDSQLQEQVNVPIGQTLADFFLRKNADMRDGDVMITDVQRGGGLLQIKLVQKSDPQAGSLTLGLQEKPMRLKKWRVIDAQGLITEVELFYLKTDLEIDKDKFIYRNPASAAREPRYND